MSLDFSIFPDLVLEIIMKRLDWKSVLTLRHVSQRLRNFIDSSNLSIFENLDLHGIEISARDEGIDLYFSSHKGSHRIQYFLEKNFSTARKFENREEALVEASSPMDLAMIDLNIMLRFQRSKFNTFSLIMSFESEEIKDSEIAQLLPAMLSNTLKSFTTKNWRLKAEKLVFYVFDQSQMSQSLPFFDSGTLKEIGIGCSIKNSNFEMDEIVKTEQWKSAEEFDSDLPDFSENLENFSHFRKVEANLKTIFAEDLDLLKKAYLLNPNFIWFRANYKELKKTEIISTFWGLPFNRYPEDEYFFRIPNTKEIFHVRNNKEYKFIWFSKIMNYEVPNGAIVQD